MSWKDTLRKAPLNWNQGKRSTSIASPEDYKTRDMARLAGTYDKPKFPKGVKGPTIPDFREIDMKVPEVQDSLGNLSEAAQNQAIQILQQYNKDIRQAYQNYKDVVGQTARPGDFFRNGRGATKLISSYNKLLQQALRLESAHKRQPWYKRLFGRGKRYRELVKKVNANANEIQQAYKMYKREMQRAGNRGETETQILESGIKMAEVHKRLASGFQDIINITNELDEDIKR